MTEESTAVTIMNRDELRKRIFGARAKTMLVENFLGGTTIEIRQPSLNVALNMRQGSEKDRVLEMLTNFAFVPGSNEQLFDREDIDAMRELPFGDEFQRLMEAVNSLLGVKPEEVEQAIKDAEKSN